MNRYEELSQKLLALLDEYADVVAPDVDGETVIGPTRTTGAVVCVEMMDLGSDDSGSWTSQVCTDALSRVHARGLLLDAMDSWRPSRWSDR